MIKISFDGQLFLKGNKTGIGWCADNVIKELAKTGEYDCQLNYFSCGYDEKKIERLSEYEQLGVRLHGCKWFHDVLYKLIWPFLYVPYSWFFGNECDITQFFNYVIPPGVKGKKITIVHDMAHLACPETVRKKTKGWLALTLRQSCQRADAIITVSEFSKQELMKYLHVPEKKIHVMYNGVNFEQYHTNYTENRIAEARNKYQIEENYFLYLGTIEPRKNLIIILKAYNKLAERYENLPQLVLAGGNGWLYDEIYKTAEELNLGTKILFTGYVDQKDGPVLMRGAQAFIFPSVYEGFGMPVAEAMACGTPVIASDIPPLHEVLGDAGIFVDPQSQEGFCSAMEHVLTNANVCDEMSKRGLERVKQFSWKNSADALRTIYRQLLEK